MIITYYFKIVIVISLKINFEGNFKGLKNIFMMMPIFFSIKRQ